MGLISGLYNLRSSFATPEQWVIDWITGGVKSRSGVDVSESTALSCGAVYAAVTLLARTVAMLPLKLFRRLSDGGHRPATELPLYRVVADEPNPEMTAYTFRETLQGHLGTWGNAYARIVTDKSGNVVELWPLEPNRMKKKRLNGRIWFYYTPQSGSDQVYPEYEILHIPGFGFNGLIGYSPISLARESIGLSLATEQFGADFFGNGANFGNFVKHPGVLSAKAKANIKQSIEEAQLDKSHGIHILEEGIDWVKNNFSPDDSQFIQTRKMNVSDIARWYHVPPHKIGDLEKATFSNIEHQSIDFVVSTMMPWFVLWEQWLKKQLLSESDKKKYDFKFVVTALLRGDAATRASYYNTRFQIGSLSPNDIRELEEQNPVKGGDKYFVPLNMVTLENAGKEKVEPEAMPEPLPMPEAAPIQEK